MINEKTRRTAERFNIIDVAKNNGLRRSGDAIEDHGTWFYFVFLHDETWKK